MPFPEWLGSSLDETLFLRRVLDHVSECLVAVDTAGLVVLINQPYCRLLGGREEDFIGRHITEVASPQTKLHLVARGEQPAQMALPLDVKGHHLLTRQVPVLHDGVIVGAVGLALFSNYELLKKAFSLASQSEMLIQNKKNAWRTQHSIDDLVGNCPRIDLMRARLKQAAQYQLPALLQGETGTGKELAAHAIHALSPRAARPFVWVNCASISETLIEAELFGYEGGSFTGARSTGRAGKFELANGGTLFLDEIGDMPFNLQASILRAVQNNTIIRVGGTAPIQIDTRIICATHKPLAQLVRDGKFREDLFYRLNVLSITLPSLRERADLAYLIEFMLCKLSSQQGIANRAATPATLNILLAHDWPGNVRELESVLLRFLLDGEIRLDSTAAPASAYSGKLNLKAHLAQARAHIIREALATADQDKNRAARLLGISRASLYRELQDSEPR